MLVQSAPPSLLVYQTHQLFKFLYSTVSSKTTLLSNSILVYPLSRTLLYTICHHVQLPFLSFRLCPTMEFGSVSNCFMFAMITNKAMISSVHDHYHYVDHHQRDVFWVAFLISLLSLTISYLLLLYDN